MRNKLPHHTPILRWSCSASFVSTTSGQLLLLTFQQGLCWHGTPSLPAPRNPAGEVKSLFIFVPHWRFMSLAAPLTCQQFEAIRDNDRQKQLFRDDFAKRTCPQGDAWCMLVCTWWNPLQSCEPTESSCDNKSNNEHHSLVTSLP